ncbi:unnamed protein product [Blepharisma stoltei]|uniref:Uncharacterized protein n=1 Tax=Blepharisma stoltei TaxID=1481888 RepID=A0AAU9J035_9CILI|nr:unnamed protein product [Blepharisma stoltei]
MPNNFEIIGFSSSWAGKYIKWSKKLYLWKIRLGIEVHILQFYESRVSGRRRAFLNGKLDISARKTSQLGQYPLRIRSHMILIFERKDHSFDLKFFDDYFGALKIIPLPESDLFISKASKCSIQESKKLFMRSISGFGDVSPYVMTDDTLEKESYFSQSHNFNSYRDKVDALSFVNKPKSPFKKGMKEINDNDFMGFIRGCEAMSSVSKLENGERRLPREACSIQRSKTPTPSRR